MGCIIPKQSVETLVAIYEETFFGYPEPDEVARFETDLDVDLSHLK
jgi:hypothetical protein